MISVGGRGAHSAVVKGGRFVNEEAGESTATIS